VRVVSARCVAHLRELGTGLDALAGTLPRLSTWATTLRRTWGDGGRLLVAGNGGSAALAEHLTAELVGRYQGEHEPWSAIALTGDTASVTAIANDYGYHRVFGRQVEAHGRQGDVLLLLSTSGRSENLLDAALAADRRSMVVWSMVGDGCSPVARASSSVVALPGPAPVVQELQQVVVHLLCELVEEAG
jgi:phosphoheptose isomerase